MKTKYAVYHAKLLHVACFDGTQCLQEMNYKSLISPAVICLYYERAHNDCYSDFCVLDARMRKVFATPKYVSLPIAEIIKIICFWI